MEEKLGPDLPVASIDRARCIEVREFLKRLPSNATKKLPNLTLTEAVSHAEKTGMPVLAPGTVAGYMQNLLAILGWAEREGWGVRLHSKRLVPPRKAQVRRRGFTPDELKTLFVALGSIRNDEPTKFWVPALALHTGARAGEICQLAAEDVVEIGGIWCLDLSEFDAEGRRVEDKSLKTPESERFVPLHPHLLDAGFLAFVEGRAGARLFPDLVPGPKGNYSHNFSKWFGRFKKKIGFTQPALVFHSFRHGFRDACRETDISDDTAHALCGWAAANQGSKYGNRGQVPRLHRAMQKIGFGDFVLSKHCAITTESAGAKRPTSDDIATGFNEAA